MFMERFQEIDKTLKRKAYTKRQLFDWIQRYYPRYDDHSCAWILGSLIKRRVLFNLGFDCYIQNGNSYMIPLPDSKRIKDIWDSGERVQSQHRYISFSPNDLEPLLGAEPSMDMIIYEVEKKSLYPLYLELKSRTKASVLLNPDDDELSRYYTEGCILLRAYPSKAPINGGHYSLENLCVDLLKDKLIESLFPLIEAEEVACSLIRNYDMNLKTLISYAERRGVKKQLIKMCYDSLPKDKLDILMIGRKFPKLEEEI